MTKRCKGCPRPVNTADWCATCATRERRKKIRDRNGRPQGTASIQSTITLRGSPVMQLKWWGQWNCVTPNLLKTDGKAESADNRD